MGTYNGFMKVLEAQTKFKEIPAKTSGYGSSWQNTKGRIDLISHYSGGRSTFAAHYRPHGDKSDKALKSFDKASELRTFIEGFKEHGMRLEAATRLKEIAASQKEEAATIIGRLSKRFKADWNNVCPRNPIGMISGMSDGDDIAYAQLQKNMSKAEFKEVLNRMGVEQQMYRAEKNGNYVKVTLLGGQIKLDAN